jgi:hypothetical protein
MEVQRLGDARYPAATLALAETDRDDDNLLQSHSRRKNKTLVVSVNHDHDT